jgi:Generalcontrol nonderepressible 1 (Gcn1) N-terminal
VFHRVLTQIISSAKSSNTLVRTNSIQLFRTIVTRTKSDDILSSTVAELLSLPKTGKSAGPDHRIALYSMLSFLTPSSSVSASIVETTTPLLAKETHEAAVAVLASALPPHLVFLLKNDASISTATTTLIAKEMNSTKPGVRRAFASLSGRVFFEANVDFSAGKAFEFAKAILPAFENSLKTVAANPLNSNGGPLEGYIAVAVLLGPLSRTGKFGTYVHTREEPWLISNGGILADDLISHNPNITSITSSPTKPSFLLWDKVYQKITDSEDEKWLLRACDASLVFFKNDFTKNEILRQVFTSVPRTSSRLISRALQLPTWSRILAPGVGGLDSGSSTGNPDCCRRVHCSFTTADQFRHPGRGEHISFAWSSCTKSGFICR